MMVLQIVRNEKYNEMQQTRRFKSILFKRENLIKVHAYFFILTYLLGTKIKISKIETYFRD